MSSLPKHYYPPSVDIHFRLTTPEEETELFRKAKGEPACAESREFLIRNHLLFAMQEARRLVGASGKLPEDEITSAANYALMLAFEKFDYTRGVRFTTYLRLYIRGQVSELWKSKFSCGNVPDPSIRSGTGDMGISFRTSSEAHTGLRTGAQTNVSDSEGGWRETPGGADVADSADHESELLDLKFWNREKLAEVVSQLQDHERSLLEEVYVKGRAFADVARDKGVSRSAVQANHSRLMKKLKGLLQEAGVQEVL